MEHLSPINGKLVIQYSEPTGGAMKVARTEFRFELHLLAVIRVDMTLPR